MWIFSSYLYFISQLLVFRHVLKFCIAHQLLNISYSMHVLGWLLKSLNCAGLSYINLNLCIIYRLFKYISQQTCIRVAPVITELNYHTRVHSNEPGSVIWLETRQLKIHAVSWRNHIEKLTKIWPQTIYFWSNMPSSHLTIFILKCLEKIPELSLTVVWQLSNFWPN